jgi:hypothetical protein
MRMRPAQVVRLILPAEDGDVRCQATVAWSIAVPAAGKIQYRAGVEFVGADANKLSAYCRQFGGPPDPTLHANDRA